MITSLIMAKRIDFDDKSTEVIIKVQWQQHPLGAVVPSAVFGP